MPYVPEHNRTQPPETPGDLNYQITNYFVNGPTTVPQSEANRWLSDLIGSYIERRFTGRFTYTVINEVMGVLSCVLREMSRREWRGTPHQTWVRIVLQEFAASWYTNVAGPYEDLAIARNGDVFP